MKHYMIKETVNHYHEIEVDDEIDIEDVISRASDMQRMFDTGYQAIDAILCRYEDKYGFDYNVLPNACGTDVVDMEVIDEIE